MCGFQRVEIHTLFEFLFYRVLCKDVNHRVLRKYLNQNSRNCSQFDNSEFRYLCKKQ